jgi:hypothetical protein
MNLPTIPIPRARSRRRGIGLLATAASALVLAAAPAAGAAELAPAPGHEIDHGPLAQLVAVNNRGVIAGYDDQQRAAVWDPRTGRETRIGAFPDALATLIGDINDRGTVVGAMAGPLGIYNRRGFRWSTTGGLVALPGLGGTDSDGLAISERGEIVGYATLADGTLRPVRWDGAGTPVDLGTPPGAQMAAAVDVNRAGTIVGWANDVDPNGHSVTRALRWPAHGGPITLPDLGGDAIPVAVNDHGVIAGNAFTPNGGSHAVLWIGDRIVDLGAVAGGLTVTGLAEDGTVIGNLDVNGTGNYRAARWTPRCGLQEVPLPTGALGSSFADDVNDRGEIIGSVRAGDVSEPYRPFAWLPAPGAAC